MDYNVVRTSAAGAYSGYKPKYQIYDILPLDFDYNVMNTKTYSRNMENFYSEGKKNPSVALMLLHEQIEKAAQNDSSAVRHIVAKETNLSGVSNTPVRLNEQRDAFNQEFNRLYPKTGELRKQIIKHTQSANIEGVAPALSTTDKLGVVTDVYQKTYPDTFERRMYIMSDGRPGKSGTVLPWKKFLLRHFNAFAEKAKHKGYSNFLDGVVKKLRVS